MAWEGIVDILKGVKRSVFGIINGLISIFETFVNAVLKGVNKLIDAINSLSFTIPDWVGPLGGKSIGFNLKPLDPVRIPRLATGAVIPPNNEFLAVLGDQKSGTNIETPLETMVEAFKIASKADNDNRDKLLLEIIEAIYKKETGIRKSELFDSVRKSAREYQNATGRLAF